MKTLAILERFMLPEIVFPLLKRLAKVQIHFYILPRSQENPPEYFKKLDQKNINILPEAAFLKSEDTYILIDRHFNPTQSNRFINKIRHTCIRIRYHNSPSSILRIEDNIFNICATQVQFYNSTQKFKGNLQKNNLVSPTWVSAPRQKTEALVTGFIQNAEWMEYLKEPKTTLKEKLENELNITLDASLPTVCYTRHGLNRDNIATKSLIRLSKYANIIIINQKNYTPPMKISQYSNMYQCPFTLKALAQTMADFNLVAINSDDLVSAIALGLRTIPVFTRNIDTKQHSGRILAIDHPARVEGRFTNFTHIFAQKTIANEFLSYFPPVDIENIEILLYQMNNRWYWKKYDKMIQSIAHEVLGTYYTEDAIERTATAIENVLQYSTMINHRKVL